MCSHSVPTCPVRTSVLIHPRLTLAQYPDQILALCTSDTSITLYQDYTGLYAGGRGTKARLRAVTSLQLYTAKSALGHVKASTAMKSAFHYGSLTS